MVQKIEKGHYMYSCRRQYGLLILLFEKVQSLFSPYKGVSFKSKIFITCMCFIFLLFLLLLVAWAYGWWTCTDKTSLHQETDFCRILKHFLNALSTHMLEEIRYQSTKHNNSPAQWTRLSKLRWKREIVLNPVNGQTVLQFMRQCCCTANMGSYKKHTERLQL